MKKFFALLLVVLMLLPSIVACGETEEPPEESSNVESSKPDNGTPDAGSSNAGTSSSTPTTPSTGDSSTKPSTGNSSTVPSTGDSSTKPSTGSSSTVPSTNPSTESSNKPTPNPNPDVEDVVPDVVTKWSGSTLNILATVWGDSPDPGAPWSQVELTVGPDDWTSEAGFGAIINPAVLRRAADIKDNYGVELNWINARGSQIATKISEAIVGGSESTKFHIAMPRMLEAQTIVATNGIYNLADQRYINLNNSYYNQVARENFSIYGTTLFVAGDFSFLDEQTSYLIYYNIAMTTGISDFPDLYQAVKEGKWTIDQMTNVAKLVKKNEGDPQWTDDDTYGYGTTNMSRFFQYSGIQQVSVVEGEYGGEYTVSLDDPKVGTLIDKILTITGADWARTNWNGGFGALQKAFEEGRLLFYDEVVQKTDYFKNQTDKFKVGILPTPKLTEDQATYYTPCSYQSVLMCIPKATPDREMSNYFFEILSYTGQKHIMTAFKENIKSNLDPAKATESMEIIENYIFANLCYDTGYMNGWTGLLSEVQTNSYASGKNNFRAEYQQSAEEALLTVSEWNTAWLDYTDSVE